MNNSWTWQPNIFLVYPTFASAVVLLLLVPLLGIITNSLLLFAHIKDPYNLLESSRFIVNIAIIDFLASLSLLVYAVLGFDVVALLSLHPP
jgi:hypothetical protein